MCALVCYQCDINIKWVCVDVLEPTEKDPLLQSTKKPAKDVDNAHPTKTSSRIVSEKKVIRRRVPETHRKHQSLVRSE